MERHIRVPFQGKEASTLQAGDFVYLTGTIYTARDAAHKRMYDMLQENGFSQRGLPLDLDPSLGLLLNLLYLRALSISIL